MRVMNGWTRAFYAAVAVLVATWLPAPLGADSSETQVDIRNYAFVPVTVTVAAGTRVTWANEPVIHTVTADDQSWDSGFLDPGASFSHVFDTPGTYGYYCIPHGAPGTGMSGTIIVTEADESGPESDPSASARPAEVAASG
ncbi:MAG: hypothetical protein NVSMB2_24040 [Chloroflexota bacterium]